jgi:hypothetical protein
MKNLQNFFGMPSSTSARLGGSLTAVALLLTTVAQPAAAAIVMTANEIGNDVVFSYSGTLDLAGMSVNDNNTSINTSRVWAQSNLVQWRTAANRISFRYLNAFSSRPQTLGSGPLTNADTSSATGLFGVSGSNLYLDDTLTASDWLNTTQSGSMTFQNNTLAGLGIAEGTYTWVLSGTAADTITLNAVPEPSSLALFGVGGVVFACVAYRRRAGKQ